MKRKTTKNKCDKLFSQIIRSLSHCEWCFKRSNLQCAHFISRSNHQVRFELANGICLCAGCHFKAHKDPQDFVEWFNNYRMSDYKYLMKRKNRLDRVDYDKILSKLEKEAK